MRSRLALALAVVVAALWSVPRDAAADTLDEVRRTGKLVWGGDQEGGGPYVYPRDDDPSKVTGFEVDLAALLARHVGASPEFSQGN